MLPVSTLEYSAREPDQDTHHSASEEYQEQDRAEEFSNVSRNNDSLVALASAANDQQIAKAFPADEQRLSVTRKIKTLERKLHKMKWGLQLSEEEAIDKDEILFLLDSLDLLKKHLVDEKLLENYSNLVRDQALHHKSIQGHDGMEAEPPAYPYYSRRSHQDPRNVMEQYSSSSPSLYRKGTTVQSVLSAVETRHHGITEILPSLSAASTKPSSPAITTTIPTTNFTTNTYAHLNFKPGSSPANMSKEIESYAELSQASELNNHDPSITDQDQLKADSSGASEHHRIPGLPTSISLLQQSPALRHLQLLRYGTLDSTGISGVGDNIGDGNNSLNQVSTLPTSTAMMEEFPALKKLQQFRYGWVPKTGAAGKSDHEDAEAAEPSENGAIANLDQISVVEEAGNHEPQQEDEEERAYKKPRIDGTEQAREEELAKHPGDGDQPLRIPEEEKQASILETNETEVEAAVAAAKLAASAVLKIDSSES